MDPKQGGVSQAVRTMIFGLAHLGINNEVVSLDGAEIKSPEESISLHTLGKGKGPWVYNAKLFPWLIENFSRFDAVIVHGLWLYPSYAVRQAIQKLNDLQQTNRKEKSEAPKVFIMPHGMLDPYFQRAAGRQLKALRNTAYWQLIEHKVVNDADGTLFTCEQERQLANKPFKPYRPKREFVIGLGVEQPPANIATMKKAFQEKCPELGDSPYFLFLSRIHQKKGVDLLIKAYKNVVNSIEPKNQPIIPRLVIAGPGLDTPYGQQINRLVKEELALGDCVFFTDMLSGDAKWGAFYGCEAFVLPSHQENFGIAVVEAMACGKPVLISNQVNIWQEIESGQGGIVEPDSLEGTQQALTKWLTLSSSAKILMGQKAESCFNEKFSIVPSAQRLLDALRA